MEILDKKIVKKDGNECLITEVVTLIRLEYDLYIVTYTQSVWGSWTGNPCDTDAYTFRDMTSAVNRYSQLCERVN